MRHSSSSLSKLERIVLEAPKNLGRFSSKAFSRKLLSSDKSGRVFIKFFNGSSSEIFFTSGSNLRVSRTAPKSKGFPVPSAKRDKALSTSRVPAKISASLEHSEGLFTKIFIASCRRLIALTSINGLKSQSRRFLRPIGVRHLSRHDNKDTPLCEVSGISSRFLCAAESKLIRSLINNGEIFRTSFSELNCVAER